MKAEIRREETGILLSRLDRCKILLQRGQVNACLVALEEVMERMRSLSMLPGDEKMLMKEIDAFQGRLAGSKAFTDLYGPVSFRENDLSTSLSFIKQLIRSAGEDSAPAPPGDPPAADAAADALRGLLEQARTLFQEGHGQEALALIDGNEEIADQLCEEFNDAGIRFRKEKRYGEASCAFRMAIALQARDEGLYYNLARTHLEEGDLSRARQAIEEALSFAPDFAEGVKLLQYLWRQTNAAPAGEAAARKGRP